LVSGFFVGALTIGVLHLFIAVLLAWRLIALFLLRCVFLL